jgi:hypothetical protein
MMQRLETICEQSDREAESDQGFFKIERSPYERPYDTSRQHSLMVLNKSC